jgi:hypothetical protein
VGWARRAERASLLGTARMSPPLAARWQLYDGSTASVRSLLPFGCYADPWPISTRSLCGEINWDRSAGGATGTRAY